MRKGLLITGIMAFFFLASCTKHEYCLCSYKTPIKGTIVTQLYHIEDMSCSDFIPEEWKWDYDNYLKPKCVKVEEE
ncbi:MAG: hypothetical protein IKY43_03550 [Bacteroidales bacterium]|jgi:hypothetical protein|nr:hypothetical protein [Bacteroidales bacterium]